MVGPNGSGKSTLIRMIVGELQPKSGKLVLAPSVRIGYISQRRDSTLVDKQVFSFFSVEHSARTHPHTHTRKNLNSLMLYGFCFADCVAGNLWQWWRDWNRRGLQVFCFLLSVLPSLSHSRFCVLISMTLAYFKCIQRGVPVVCARVCVCVSGFFFFKN